MISFLKFGKRNWDKLIGRFQDFLAAGLMLAFVASLSCSTGNTPTPSALAVRDAGLFTIALPASLEKERGAYERDIRSALDDVASFFTSAGYALPDKRIIESVLVFERSSEAREYMAKEFGAPLEGIPETFAGTVVETRLFLVSRDAYRSIWSQLYPEWPWTEAIYRQLIVHEVAHRAHEAVAMARFGSAEAMGPGWFFEGLAVVCAGQFEADLPPMSRAELEGQVGAGHLPVASYPQYGHIVRSLADLFGMKDLIAGASNPAFPDNLWSPMAPVQPVEK